MFLLLLTSSPAVLTNQTSYVIYNSNHKKYALFVKTSKLRPAAKNLFDSVSSLALSLSLEDHTTSLMLNYGIAYSHRTDLQQKIYLIQSHLLHCPYH